MQGAYSYRNAFHAVSSIVQQQGLPGLMKGYWATNSVWFPWNMIYIASYEKSKAMLARQLQASTCAPGGGHIQMLLMYTLPKTPFFSFFVILCGVIGFVLFLMSAF